MAAFEGLSASEKEELVVSLSALLCADAGVELSAENISKAITASGNKVGDQYAPVFAAALSKAGGVEKYLQAPGAGMTECERWLRLLLSIDRFFPSHMYICGISRWWR